MGSGASKRAWVAVQRRMGAGTLENTGNPSNVPDAPAAAGASSWGGFDTSYLGPIATIASGLLARNSAKSANDQNRLNALTQMQFQKDEAQKAREWDATQNWSLVGWQEKMANTAYQRQTADLKAAGLNPLLALTKGGGAATPSASAGRSGSPSGASFVAQPTVTAQTALIAASAAQTFAQTELIKAETRKTDAETGNLAYHPALVQAQTQAQVASAGHSNATAASVTQEMASFQPRMARLEEETKHIAEQARLAAQQGRVLSVEEKYRAQKLISDIQQTMADAQRLRVQADLLKLEIPKAVNDAGSQDNWYSRTIRPYFNEVVKGLGAVGAGAVGGAAVRSIPKGAPKTYTRPESFVR